MRVGGRRKHRSRGRAAIPIVVWCLVSFAIGAPATASSRPGSRKAYEHRIVELVNAERAQRSVAPLRPGRCADGFATRWSERLATGESLRHQQMRAVLDGCGAHRAAENIGRGAVSAERMVALWMRSRRHRANLLDARFTRIGVGAAQSRSGTWYAVTNFLAY
jgi:uncharacterized protein YkwD